MTPMTPAERQSVAGPYRETFLAGLRPDVAAALQQAGEHFESAMLEVWGAPPEDIPFSILWTRATLIDLEALAGSLGDLVDDSGGSLQETQFRDDLTEVLSLLKRAQGQLAKALSDAETRLLRACADEADA